MSKLNIKPIAGSQNRVVVEAAAAEEKTAGGIIIPDTAKEKPQKGKIVATSEQDEKGVKPVVKVGDSVLYGKYAGTEIIIDGKDYLIMKESDIYAIV
ncbi:MAG: co-chaperone GroES [Bacteroidales bacterium]|jgi:chaperonin GroES